MKKFFLFFIGIIGISLCSCSTNTKTDIFEDKLVDSLLLEIRLADSLMNSGSLVHVDYYPIGEFGGYGNRSIEMTVVKITTEDNSISYIRLSKDISTSYSYENWESATMMPEEVKYMSAALDKMESEFSRITTHQERYLYTTKDDIQLLSFSNETDGTWTINFSIDKNKNGANSYLNKDNIPVLRSLLSKALDKINEIE